MSFLPAVTNPDGIRPDAWWFIFKGNRLLVRQQDGSARVFSGPLPAHVRESSRNINYIGRLGVMPCFCAEADETVPDSDGPYAFQGLRSLYGILPEDMMSAAGTAFQVILWDRTHKLCGACGAPLLEVPGERGRRCERCDLVFYPRIAPAIITAILDGEKILLAHNRKFPEGLFSLIAGFVEAGESLEECVRREVKEEVGIDLKRITYFGSQPWPFPNSLMIGFFAEYAGGEIRPDEVEITDAKWFTPDTLPNIPAAGSIARRIIDEYLSRFGRR